MRNLIIFAILCLALTQLNAQQNIMGSDAQRAAGKVIYDDKCAQCHGYEGDAASVAKTYFRPQPRDFTAATYKFRSTPNGELPTTEDIKRSIRLGMPYTGMPAWPEFSDQELTNLAYYLKTFAQDVFEEYGSTPSIDLQSPPAYSDASRDRGRMVYEENQCLDCHGEYGRGDGKSAPTLVDQWNEPIRPADLTKRWTYRGGATRTDIARTFITGLDGSPMPSYSIEPIEDQWALVDYVYSLGGTDDKYNEANYSVAAFATPYKGDIVIQDVASAKQTYFQNTEVSTFPVVGQVVEPGRAFFPGVNSINIQTIVNEDDIAIMLTWHDMSAETSGGNDPSVELPIYTPDSPPDTMGQYSDAVAVFFPTQESGGPEKPYLMFGDSKLSVDLWYSDLSKSEAQVIVGKGIKSMEPAAEQNLQTWSEYDNGQWTVIFQRKRVQEGAVSFDQEDVFVPIAFTVWDGYNKERGNKRGMTSWYSIHIPTLQKPSPVGPMVETGFWTFLVLGLIVAGVKLRYRNGDA